MLFLISLLFLNMKKYIYFLVCLFACSLLACSKYDDGPWISLRGKENRLINPWKYSLVLRNGDNVMDGKVPGTINYTESTIGFNDEGRFTEVNTINSVASQRDGDWSFDEDKEILQLTFDDGSIDKNLIILKLKHEEFWFKEEAGDNLMEYHLEPNL